MPRHLSIKILVTLKYKCFELECADFIRAC